jgi:hypothetical protein
MRRARASCGVLNGASITALAAGEIDREHARLRIGARILLEEIERQGARLTGGLFADGGEVGVPVPLVVG